MVVGTQTVVVVLTVLTVMMLTAHRLVRVMTQDRCGMDCLNRHCPSDDARLQLPTNFLVLVLVASWLSLRLFFV